MCEFESHSLRHINMIELSKDLIKGFVGSCLVKGFDGSKPIPQFHEDMWELCTSKHRFVAIAAPRG